METKMIFWVFMVIMATTYVGKTEGYLCYWDCVDACKVSGPECWYPCLDKCNPPMLSRTSGEAPAMSPEVSEAPSTKFSTTIAEQVFTSKVDAKAGIGQPLTTEGFFFFDRPSNRKLIPRQ
ncbi:hypothetical protein MKX01_025521 [Papaver californicum]|nr:hypothetical protein MKX01_025521 [Papaver californicum]